MPRFLFAFCLLWRLLSWSLVRTWFVPDELFQSVEPAHLVVFDTGHLSWEWHHGLRAILHPAIFALLYSLARMLGLDEPGMIAELPRLFHTLLFALSDLCFLQLARKFTRNHSSALITLLFYYCNWFVFYCAPRTLGNGLETALTVIALNWYPFDRGFARVHWPYLVLASLAIVVRPTAVLLWAPLGLWHLWRHPSPLKLILFSCLPSMLPVFLFSLLADSFFYSRLTFSLWNFAVFNVFEGGSAHFGVHPWFWYLVDGIPAVFTVQLIPIALGAFDSNNRIGPVPLLLSVFYLVFHSLLAHKEHRFLLPLVPLLSLYGGEFYSRHLRDRLSWSRLISMPRIPQLSLLLILLVNVPLALYTSLIHQRGPLAVAEYLRSPATSPSFRVWQLMPCYSMPQYAHLHGVAQSAIRSLDCSPNFHTPGMIDEADRFFESPREWLEGEWAKPDFVRPSHLVLFESLARELSPILASLGYTQCARFFHAHFLTGSRQDFHIVLMCSDL